MKEQMNWLEMAMNQTQIQKILETNVCTSQYGLTLSEQESALLVKERRNALRRERRVEFGESILPKIIYIFCDSSFIQQEEYVPILTRLQEIFFLYKNEMMDEITDDELLNFMKEQYETVCAGDLDYLEGTCLDLFAQAIRAGYRGYESSDGQHEFTEFDIVPRWDRQLYWEALKNLF